MPAPAAATDQQIIWKSPEIMRFARSLIHHAIMATYAGNPHFTTDVVPDADRGDGSGIAGSVVTMLKNASLIENVGVFSLGKFYADRAKSERPDAKGRFVAIYKLTSPALAQEFLRRNGVAATQQGQLL